MRDFLTYFSMLVLSIAVCLPLSGQDDLLKGIFDKEEPEFHTTILPTASEGAVLLIVHFSHSKITSLEASFWIKDQGANFTDGGVKRLVRGLQDLGNRQQDTILLEGLVNNNFYAIGVDYRNPSSLTRKFIPKVIKKGYRYTYDPSIAQKTEPARPAARNQNYYTNDTSFEEPAFPEEQMSSRSIDQRAKSPAAVPCQEPNINLIVEPSGYCKNRAKPAVVVQCLDCHGKNWEFSVEVRSNNRYWRSLRGDGKHQSSFGVSLRTEPLCLLAPGEYFVRVLAWGENCSSPVIKEFPTSIIIPGNTPESTAHTPTQTKPASPYLPPANSTGQINLSSLPDTCIVDGWVRLNGNKIAGTLELAGNSPCRDYNPFAKVKYIHPGHRDLTINYIPLKAGSITPFEIPLDREDLQRGIHTVQVAVYVKPTGMLEGVPMGSFWMKAGDGASQDLTTSNTVPNNPATTNSYGATTYHPTEPVYGSNTRAKGNSNQPTVDDSYKSSIDESAYDAMMEENIDMVQVTASDPNCTQIQDLRLVYFSSKSEEPLYISWLNPRCCQETGCDYTVWAGKNPKQLRLIVEGNKRGAIIKELLHDLMTDDQYFEIVVKTGNGVRKAAYAIGEGPKYGFEEILAYQDGTDPQRSDTLMYVKGDSDLQRPPISKKTSFSWNDAETSNNMGVPDSRYNQPKRSIADFRPCKYARETILSADDPINPGDEISIKYDFSDKGYKHTLYLLPENSTEWVIAPGTEELQSSSEFTLEADPAISGKYIILTFKNASNWGCLSAPLEEALEVKVVEER